MKHLYRTLPLLGGLLALTLIGCSSNKGTKIKGTVTMDGNTPLTKAILEFAPADPQSNLGGEIVTTDENGHFEILSDKKKAPMKPGQYVVLITKWVDPKTGKPPEETEGMDMEQLKLGGKLKNIVPMRYSSREFPQHLLKVEIKEGDNDLKLDVKSK